MHRYGLRQIRHLCPNLGQYAPAHKVLRAGGMNGALAIVDTRASDVRSSSAAPKILIADDDRDMCELAEAGLSQRGYGVSWRLSPDEALAHLDNEDFSILLVDIHMEGMSGLDLCRAALAKRPGLVVV